MSALPDQDTFYDVTDALEELGMERVTQRHMKRKGADLDLLAQFQQYEVRMVGFVSFNAVFNIDEVILLQQSVKTF